MDTIVKAKIGGKPHKLQFNNVRIRQNLFSHCEIVLQLSFDEHLSASVIDNAVNSWLGEELECSIIDRVDTKINKIYKGNIVNISSSSNKMELIALSEDHLLSAGGKYNSFVNMDVIGIAKDIIQKNGLKSTNVLAPTKSNKFIFFQQYDESDYNCLKRLAKYDGCVFYHDGEYFTYAGKPGVMGSVSLGLEEISGVRINLALDRTKWRGMPYNYTKHTEPADSEYISSPFTLPTHPFSQKAFDKSKKVFSSVTEELYNQAINDKSSFEAFLIKQQEYSAGKMVVVSGSTKNPMVSIGKIISCPKHSILANKLVVTSLYAIFQANEYKADFEAIAEGAIIEPNIDDSRKFIHDTARVIDNIDISTLGRVQIQYLWDLKGTAHTWARIAQFGAGMTAGGVSYGSHYTPRIGDHVLVACENGDPSLPIIIGSLYHSEHKPDFKTNNGTEEVLVVRTPQESTIRVLDKPGSEEVVISMKGDKNLIRLELKQPQITVESLNGTIILHSKFININADEKIKMTAKEVEMTASKNIKIAAGENYDLTTGKNYTLKVGGNSEEKVSSDKNVTVGSNSKKSVGANAEIKSGAKLKLNSVQIESAASAINVIKGALVQIN